MSFSIVDSLWPTMSLPYVALAPTSCVSSTQWYVPCQLMAPRQWSMPSFRAGLIAATRYLLASPIRRLQSLQDAAARPVRPTGAPRREHITPILSNFIGYQYVSVFHTSWKSWYSDHYQARRRRILPTIASTLLNPDGGHSDQRNDPSASYNAATRSFVVAGARAWNNLPASLRNTELTMDTFCKHLKNCFVY